jgi:ElaB/YqjD/DUF883 family membrane-anchored ribosome-binding protein
MTKKSQNASNLTEAIEQLEGLRQTKTEEFKEIFSKDIEEVKKAFEDLKPTLESLREKAETEVKKVKKDVESKVKENPWVTLGIVGLVAFVIGWILGTNKKD